MSKNTKIILVVVLAIGGLCLLCCGGFMAIGFFGAKDGVAAQQEGRQFGRSATQQDCQEATWKRAANCTAMDFSCPVTAEGFFKGCLSTATETAGFCDHVPKSGAKSMEEAFTMGMEAAKFAQNTCAELGRTPFRPRDESVRPQQQVCVQVVQTRVINCNAQDIQFQ